MADVAITSVAAPPSRMIAALKRGGARLWIGAALTALLVLAALLAPMLAPHDPPEPAPPEQPATDLTPTEKAFRAFGEKLDNLNGKLDALLKHYDIVWQPGESPAADE